MYEMKTLLPQFDIKPPTCMYSMKSLSLNSEEQINYAIKGINGHRNASSLCTDADIATTTCPLNLDKLSLEIKKIIKSSDETKTITVRQEKVLQQLNNLKTQMAQIRSSLGLCQKGMQAINNIGINGSLKEETLHDLVINGHPNFIPYALLALKQAWKNLFTIDVKTFTHSTLPDIGKDAKEFEEKLKKIPIDPSKPVINVTLIWKNCEHTEMISSPTMYVPIYGEVNIIRYLGRVGPSEYRYEDSLHCNEIDLVLDICYQLLRCTTSKARANMLKVLNGRLQNQAYFGGDKMSVADIGVYSSLKRMPAITDKDLTPAMLEWRKRAQNIVML